MRNLNAFFVLLIWKLVLSDWWVRQCMIICIYTLKKLKLLSLNDQRAEKYSKALLCCWFHSDSYSLLGTFQCILHIQSGCNADFYWKMGQTQYQTLKPQSRSKGAKLLLILLTNKECSTGEWSWSKTNINLFCYKKNILHKWICSSLITWYYYPFSIIFYIYPYYNPRIIIITCVKCN